jgi:hypothetical protein
MIGRRVYTYNANRHDFDASETIQDHWVYPIAEGSPSIEACGENKRCSSV